MIGKLFDSLLEHIIDLVTLGFDMIIMACQSIFSVNLTIFESIFPSAKTLYSGLLGLSVGIVVAIFLVKVFSLLLPYNQNRDNPFQILLRSLFTLFFVMFARQFLGLLLAYGNSFFIDLRNIKIDGDTNNTTHLAGNTYKAIVNACESDNLITKTFKSISGFGVVTKILAFIFSIFVVYSFCKLVTTAVKNNVILGFFGSIVSIPVAFYAATETESIFKSYMKALLGQMMSLYIGLWFIRVGSNAIINMNVPKITSEVSSVTYGAFFGPGGVMDQGATMEFSSKFNSLSSAIIWCLVIGYYFQIGININSYIRELGIGVTGTSGRSFIGSAANLALRGMQVRRYMGFGGDSGLSKKLSGLLNETKMRQEHPGLFGDNSNFADKHRDAWDSVAKQRGELDENGIYSGGAATGAPKENADSKSAKNGQKPSANGFGSATNHGDKGNQDFGTNTKRGQKGSSVNGKNDIYSQDPKSAIRSGVRKAAQQKLSGDEARDAVMGAMEQNSNRGVSGIENGIKFSNTDGTSATFTDISTDGFGCISGRFGNESVEILSQERFDSQKDGNFDTEDYKKVNFGGETMYVNKTSAPSFSKMFQTVYDV